MLFDTGERRYDGPADVGETEYEFLNRSAAPEVVIARNRIEDLLAQYPSEGLVHLEARLRSDDQNFNGALFELVLFNAFVRLGCEVELCDIIGDAKRPDFLITHGDKRSYVEATVVDPREGILESNVYERDVLAKLETLEQKGLGLLVETEGILNRLLRKKYVTRPFRELMDAHDPADIEDLVRKRGIDAAPCGVISDGDWSLKGRLIAIDGDQIVHGVSGDAKWLNPARAFELSVATKAQKYGELDAPLVVAANARELGFDVTRNAMDALFGRIVVDIATDRKGIPVAGVESQTRRVPGGVWINRGGNARYTRLKAVLTVARLGPYNLDPSVVVYFNPFVQTRELPDALYALPHTVDIDGLIEYVDGRWLGPLLFD